MRNLIRRSRGLVVALVVLGLTATVALAARPATAPPAAATDGLNRAAEAAGKTVPATGAQSRPEQAPATDAPATEAPEADAPEADAPADSHGATVSAAAQAETPEGFDNHGAYVSPVAKANHGHETAAAAKAKAKPSH